MKVGDLIYLYNPKDQWNTDHQLLRPLGIILKVYPNVTKQHETMYRILFTNGSVELEMAGFLSNRYRVVV